jgi:hypothetical protein
VFSEPRVEPSAVSDRLTRLPDGVGARPAVEAVVPSPQSVVMLRSPDYFVMLGTIEV